MTVWCVVSLSTGQWSARQLIWLKPTAAVTRPLVRSLSRSATEHISSSHLTLFTSILVLSRSAQCVHHHPHCRTLVISRCVHSTLGGGCRWSSACQLFCRLSSYEVPQPGARPFSILHSSILRRLISELNLCGPNLVSARAATAHHHT